MLNEQPLNYPPIWHSQIPQECHSTQGTWNDGGGSLTWFLTIRLTCLVSYSLSWYSWWLSPSLASQYPSAHASTSSALATQISRYHTCGPAQPGQWHKTPLFCGCAPISFVSLPEGPRFAWRVPSLGHPSSPLDPPASWYRCVTQLSPPSPLCFLILAQPLSISHTCQCDDQYSALW